MIQKIKSVLGKLSKIRLLPEYLKVTARQAMKKLPANDRQIVFTLDDPRLFRDDDGSGRYAYLIMKMFNDGGYNVYLHKNVDFPTFTRLGYYGRFLYTIDNLKVINRVPRNPENMIYAFDKVHARILDRP